MLAFTLTSNLAGFIPVFSLALLGLFVTSAPLCARPPRALLLPALFLLPYAGAAAWRAWPGAWRARSVVPHVCRSRARRSHGLCDGGRCMRADAVSMWAVPIPQRPAAQAMQIILMHVLGDVPSPPIVGAVQGAPPPAAGLYAARRVARVARLCGSHARLWLLRASCVWTRVWRELHGSQSWAVPPARAGAINNWRVSMSVITAPLGLSVLIYLAGTLCSRSAPDYREELLREPLATPEVRPLAAAGLSPRPAQVCVSSAYRNIRKNLRKIHGGSGALEAAKES